MTFIIRLSLSEAGRVSGGVLERVRTGEKQRFESLEALAPLIARMVTKSEAAPRQGVRERRDRN